MQSYRFVEILYDVYIKVFFFLYSSMDSEEEVKGISHLVKWTSGIFA